MSIFWMASATAIKGTLADTLLLLLVDNKNVVVLIFARLALDSRKHENKSLKNYQPYGNKDKKKAYNV